MVDPLITFEREVILRKVARIPDARFKSGYREVKILAENRYYFPADITGTQITQSHIYKQNGKMIKTDAFADVTFALTTREQVL